MRHIARNHLSVAAVQRGIRPIAHFAAEKRRLAIGADVWLGGPEELTEDSENRIIS